MDNHWFRLTLPDEMLRKMTRKQYYQVQSWLRLARRRVREEIEVDQDKKNPA